LLKIGEVAAQTGLSVDALRYYERLGLLPRAARTPSGYRLYDRRVIERVDFIKRAHRVGFTLEEIRQMLSLEAADPQTCEHVLGMIEAKLRELDRRYEEIKRLRRELSAYKAECERAIARQESCPVIEDFIHPRARRRRGTGEKGPHVSVRKSKCER
jgi:MerR family Zn(II)-responsive transcriptional regulator of zntA